MNEGVLTQIHTRVLLCKDGFTWEDTKTKHSAWLDWMAATEYCLGVFVDRWWLEVVLLELVVLLLVSLAVVCCGPPLFGICGAKTFHVFIWCFPINVKRRFEKSGKASRPLFTSFHHAQDTLQWCAYHTNTPTEPASLFACVGVLQPMCSRRTKWIPESNSF